MANIEVIEFQKEFPIMNLRLMKDDKAKYDMSILIAYTLETERGFIVAKQYKTTKKGTKFKYKACKNEEEAKEYSLKLKALLDKYNEEYNTNYYW